MGSSKLANLARIARLDNVFVKADDEHETRQVKEELHRLKNIERITWQALIKVINKNHDAGSPARGELFEDSRQFCKGRNIE